MIAIDASGNDPIEAGTVKLMIFFPSRRQIWTVVGKDHEYWVDPGAPFCSCSDFYFSSLSGGNLCYHLRSVIEIEHEIESKDFKSANKLEIIQFEDQEYPLLLKALASDAEKILSD
jgi:predicted nucleic acid-binding Zn finger protein